MGKRAVEATVSALLLIGLSPLLLCIASLVWLTMGPPVLFRQARAGYLGRPFQLCKFRTMQEFSSIGEDLLSDRERLTGIGRLLRRTSLDELPELWNILRGEMSFVGPRPLLMEYLPLYSPRQGRRHDVPPGLTGWAQVNGRNDLSWEKKLELDVWYLENQSLLLDLRILVRTVLQVFTGDGVSQKGHATTEKFLGSKGEVDS